MSIRLIDVKTLRLKSFNSQNAPSYAVLSHTWFEDEEVSFQEMCQIAQEPSHTATRKSGYRKIWETCRVSLAYGLNYAWVDTCCIDKSSSAELSEAINSMFRWYRDAKVCFAYLSDYSFLGSGHAWKMEDCKWFTRGWCLQELIAPKELIFYDKDWKESGSKSELKQLVARVTRIDRDVLEDLNVMYTLPVAKRMSWASQRETTRVEDSAYCLLGIFDIHMPMLYGEGDKAFSRLQEEIVRRFNDTSIFLFSPKTSVSSTNVDSTQTVPGTSFTSDIEFSATDYLADLSNCQFRGMFANSPADFRDCGDIGLKSGLGAPLDREAFSVTNRGVQLGSQVLWHSRQMHCSIWNTDFGHCLHEFIYDGSQETHETRRSHGEPVLLHREAVFLRKVGRNLFVRVIPPSPLPFHTTWVDSLCEDVCVLRETSSIQPQIYNALRKVLRIRFKDNVGFRVSFSLPTPMEFWDESGKLFLLQRPQSAAWTSIEPLITSVQLTVNSVHGGEKERVENVDLYCLMRFSGSSSPDRPYVYVKGGFSTGYDSYTQTRIKSLTTGPSSSHVGSSFKVDAKIYLEHGSAESMIFTCLVEVRPRY